MKMVTSRTVSTGESAFRLESTCNPDRKSIDLRPRIHSSDTSVRSKQSEIRHSTYGYLATRSLSFCDTCLIFINFQRASSYFSSSTYIDSFSLLSYISVYMMFHNDHSHYPEIMNSASRNVFFLDQVH